MIYTSSGVPIVEHFDSTLFLASGEVDDKANNSAHQNQDYEKNAHLHPRLFLKNKPKRTGKFSHK